MVEWLRIDEFSVFASIRVYISFSVLPKTYTLDIRTYGDMTYMRGRGKDGYRCGKARICGADIDWPRCAGLY